MMEQRGPSQQRPRLTRALIASAVGVSILGAGLVGCQSQGGNHPTSALNHEEQHSAPQPTLSDSDQGSPSSDGSSAPGSPSPSLNQQAPGQGSGHSSGQAGGQVTQSLEPGFYSLPIYDGALNCEVGTSAAPFADCWADFTTTWKEISGDHRQVKRARFFNGPARIDVTGEGQHPQHSYAPVQASGSVKIGDVVVSWPTADEITFTTDGQSVFSVGPDYYTVK